VTYTIRTNQRSSFSQYRRRARAVDAGEGCPTRKSGGVSAREPSAHAMCAALPAITLPASLHPFVSGPLMTSRSSMYSRWHRDCRNAEQEDSVGDSQLRSEPKIVERPARASRLARISRRVGAKRRGQPRRGKSRLLDPQTRLNSVRPIASEPSRSRSYPRSSVVRAAPTQPSGRTRSSQPALQAGPRDAFDLLGARRTRLPCPRSSRRRTWIWFWIGNHADYDRLLRRDL